MGNQRLKLWVGIGACVLAGGTTATAAEPAQPEAPRTHAAPSLIASAADYGGEGGEASSGGEGGEGGEAAGACGPGAGGEGGEGGEAAAGGEGGEGGEAAAGGEGGEGGEAAAGGEGGEGGEAAAGGEGGEGGEAAAGGEGGEAAAGGEGGGGAGPMSVFGGGGEGGGEGGEGGEGGSYGPSATESAGVYYTQLALMLGHMEVGRALYEAGQAGIGSTHLGHPAAEHLPAVRTALAERGLDDTCARIEELAETATGNPDWSSVQPIYDATVETIHGAMGDVPAGQRQDPAFLAKVLTAMLHQARHEYEEAIDDGRFVADHEYHDSYGFVQVGHRLLTDNAPAFEAADAEAYAELREHYERVMAAWPTPTVPSKPALSVSALYGRISAFELAAGRFD